MIILQAFRIALDMLRLHKLRAFLTMLGVIIGVMSVTMIVMISNGFQAYIDGQFRKLGADTIMVMFDSGRRGRGTSLGNVKSLKNEDLAFLMDRVSTIDIGSSMMSVPAQKVHYGDLEFPNPTIYATDENFQELNRFALIEGRPLSHQDVALRSNVCVIGEDLKNRLFPNGGSPVGKLLLFNGIALEVVGVIEKSDFMGDSTARLVVVPITTAQDKWVGGDRVDIIMMRPKPGVKVDDAMDGIWQALMVRSNNKAIYRIDSRESILKVFSGIVGAAGIILAAVAALSLLVGGIGIMNIMLVSVTERTKEIGLRKAVGAKQGSVLTQFLVEAATLSLVGGLIGMGIAWSLGQVVSLITIAKAWPSKEGLATPFPITAGLFAAAFSALIGMVFGLYPAISAAKLDPIVALRRE